MAVGRISGPLLKANLLRDGVDLAFENDLLYLDVNNMRVGIKTSAPTHDLHVNGTTRTTNLEVTNQLDVGPITILGNVISSSNPIIYLNPLTNHVVYQSTLTVDSIDITTNLIEANAPNTDLEFATSGTGSMKVWSDMFVDGNIHATGNISADGNIQIGDQNTDNITFNADISSNIIPNTDSFYNLGSPTQRWNDVWTQNFIATYVSATSVVADGVALAQTQGNIIYVSVNGDDNNSGTHQSDTFLTIDKALKTAIAGDTVYVYPGTYEEDCPLVVPQGVTLRGASLRNTIVKPVTSDPARDIFYLNGECTIEDITVQDFYYDNFNDTGYAFKFANNFKVTNRSPYIRNVSVITKGTVTSSTDPRGFDTGDAGKGAYIDGGIADPTTNEASMLFHSVTFLCPGIETVTMTNGARVEWLNCFTYWADKGLYGISGTTGIGGAGRTRLKVSGLTGSYLVGETVSYYAEDGITLLASGTIADTTGGYIYINGKASGFLEYSERVGKTVTVAGSAQISTTQSKFGGASGQFVTATSDRINVAANDDFAFGTGDFTVEFWIYFVASASTQCIFDMRTSALAQAALTLDVTGAGNINLYVQGANQITTAATLADTTWHHIAISRVSGTTRLFINGTVEVTTYTDANNYAAKPFNLGAYWDNTSYLNAYVDDLRISKGIGRYTTTFIAPTSPFGSDSNTVLLLHFNGTNGSTVFEDDSTIVQDIQFSGGATATQIDLADYTDFGCEVRSIGSAAVYGNYGIYGDGEGVVMYLIGQNLAYIGAGKSQENDVLSVIQANEVVELNNAHIYYTSVDHKGDFRVGDLFYVNQATGAVEFSNTIVNITGATGLTFTDGSQTTIIQPSKIETGNIRIYDNTIASLSGDVNIVSANNNINLQNDVNITGNLDVTGDVTIGGNITVGDNTTDSVQFIAGIDSDLIPNLPATYNVGSASLQWKDLWVRTAHISDIEINTNYIRTTVSNADLELRANGTGSILVEDIRINQNVISTDSGNIQITPVTTLDITATTTNVNGDFHVTGDVSFDNNLTLGNANNDTVTFNARVSSDIIPNITGIHSLGSPTNTWSIAHLSSAYVDDILIDTNIIQTTVSNSNLELRANGTGSIQLEQTYVNENLIYTVGNNLLIQPATTLDITASTTNVNGDFHVTGNTSFDSNITLGNTSTDNVIFEASVSSNIIPSASGIYNLGSSNKAWQIAYLASAYIDDIYIDTNIIQTTVSNSNLELRANGTGVIRVEKIDLYDNIIKTNGTDNLIIQPATTLDITASTTNVNGDLHVTGNTSIDGNTTLGNTNADTVTFEARVNSSIVPTISGTYDLGAPTKSWGVTYLSNAFIDDIRIDTNIIQTTVSNSNLELRANGTGLIRFEQIDVDENKIITNGSTNLEIRPATTLDIFADTNINGNINVTGNVTIGGNITVGNQDTDNITFVADINSDLIPNIPVTYNLGSEAKRWKTLYSANAIISDIEINTNYIRTTVSNADLELRANGTGAIKLEDVSVNQNVISVASGTNLILQPSGTGIVDVNSTQALRIPRGTTGERPGTPLSGMIRYNTTNNNYEGYDGTYWRVINGLYDVDQNTYLVAESTPGANDDTFFFFANGSQIADLDDTRLNAVRVEVDDIVIDGNTISSVNNQTIQLTSAGSGKVQIEDFLFKDSTITNSVLNGVTTVTQTGSGYFKIDGTTGFVIPVGTGAQRPGGTPETGFMRFNTDDQRVEVYNGTTWQSAAGSASGVTVIEAEEISLVYVLIFG